ncbi:hypothetical protein QAD02_016933 [Eretmocerus hayati]|uniref:Uncharacterized protein n=1 Tax=Eretmocerus hayati TaxID=131215 RepID=A0ACC2PE96_9HYME|nr:hypothetical protein QAD02_016933 [Eretmocerus hayati]
MALVNGPTSPTSPTLSESSSRIPRPSPSALRRSNSLRLKGERSFRHQQHHELFPVITENGTDSPRRSVSSLSLTPLRSRRSGGSGLPGCASSSSQYGCNSLGEDCCSDVDSVRSFGSNLSSASACDHATFALNGTTWSARTKRYVVHCSSHADSEQYLTPTQRAARQVRKFQILLRDARKEIEEKECEIARLTKELVELRLYKASLSSPDDKTDNSAASEAATVREKSYLSPSSPDLELDLDPENEASCSLPPLLTDASSLQLHSNTPTPPLLPPRTPEKLCQHKESSLVDSGHFDDGSLHSKEGSAVSGIAGRIANMALLDDSLNLSASSSGALGSGSVERHPAKKLVDHYESRIEDMHRRHVDEVQILKQTHNDKVEGLLNQLSELSTRYCETRPSLDAAEARTKELESELEKLREELAEQKALLADQEERNKQMYLKMFTKGQEAARIQQNDQVVLDQAQSPAKVSVAELLQQLTVTQAELENVKPFQESRYTPEPLSLASRSQSLLSVNEAVSLWVLGTRKVMYRRIVESRNSQGALDPEITLQFLKSAIYYFLTDKDNLQGHLNAIESILGFSEAEKHNIDRIYGVTRK